MLEDSLLHGKRLVVSPSSNTLSALLLGVVAQSMQGFISNALGAVIVSHVTKGFCKGSVVEGSSSHKVKKLEPKIHAECSWIALNTDFQAGPKGAV